LNYNRFTVCEPLTGQANKKICKTFSPSQTRLRQKWMFLSPPLAGFLV